MSNVAEDSGFAVVCLRGLRERLSSAGGLVVALLAYEPGSSVLPNEDEWLPDSVAG
jgi:hypothetical protein